MARLTKLPSKAIVNKFKGTIDFYYWKGMPCARSWPRWPPRVPTAPELANQELFAYAMRQSKLLLPVIRQAYLDLCYGTPYRWQDLFCMGYICGFHF